MAPIWPFKKKATVDEVDDTPPAPIVYKRGDDLSAQSSVGTDEGAYQDALALFGGGSVEVEAASDQSVNYDGITSASADTQTEDASDGVNGEREDGLQQRDEAASSQLEGDGSTWVHHTDGYHYKQNSDGSFEPTAHVKNDAGEYIPYS